MFKINAPFQPTGDQPQAIKTLVHGVKKGTRHQTLLGVTGSGKTFTMANVIAQTNVPTLVMCHNKTLAAQLASEFEEFFPESAVHYFVSYYDYYQPEAYIPTSDTYIEKETDINEEIDRLRHAATQAILSRKDVIIVASVSCIYGLGSPEEYQSVSLQLDTANTAHDRVSILRKLIDMQYERNDIDLHRGTFRVRGDIVDVFPIFALEKIWRLEFTGNRLVEVSERESLTGRKIRNMDKATIFPATHYIAPQTRVQEVLKEIEHDLDASVKQFLAAGKPLEAERLSQRVRFDLEMIRATGFCQGIENYSRYFDGRKEGEPPYTLVDFFRYADPRFLTFIDESHMTVPQIRGMYEGDRSRKNTLIEYGFRLPAARDNRPLTFDEFSARVGRTIYVSATPGEYEMKKSIIQDPKSKIIESCVTEQLVRPTGLLDPTIEIRPIQGQVEHLLNEIRARVKKKQRVLVTTLTKRIAEDLAEYIEEMDIKAAYIHADVDTFERLELLRDLRLGIYDVLVGINLLREGLDLPEVSLVAILDADKEGFLRSDTSFIQIMGRAARHMEGHVIMYADTITGSMWRAIEETKRRRAIQEQYNTAHNITPQSIRKKIKEGVLKHRKQMGQKEVSSDDFSDIPAEELPHLIKNLGRQMDLAAKNLEFEKAARIRDQLTLLEKKKSTAKAGTSSRGSSFAKIKAAK